MHKVPVILHDSASLTNLTALLPQSHDYGCYIKKRILAPPRLCSNTLVYAHTTSRTLPNCDVSLGSLKLPAAETGGFCGN